MDDDQQLKTLFEKRPHNSVRATRHKSLTLVLIDFFHVKNQSQKQETLNQIISALKHYTVAHFHLSQIISCN